MGNHFSWAYFTKLKCLGLKPTKVESQQPVNLHKPIPVKTFVLPNFWTGQFLYRIPLKISRLGQCILDDTLDLL